MIILIYITFLLRETLGCNNQEDCGSWMICDLSGGNGFCDTCNSDTNCDGYSNNATKYQCFNECEQMKKCKSLRIIIRCRSQPIRARENELF